MRGAMKLRSNCIAFAFCCFTVTGFSAQAQIDKVVAGDPDPRAEVIHYNKLITPSCDAVERYNTVFHVPKGEKIVDIAVGDAGIWTAARSEMGDAAYLKPAMIGLKTNIDISTDHGNHYSCFVQDMSGVKDYRPKLNIFFEPTDKEMLDALERKATVVSMAEFEAVKHAAEQYKLQADEAHAQAELQAKEIRATAKQEAISSLVRDYVLPDKAKGFPWFAQEIARDDQHTYIFVDPQKLESGAEVGSVYEKLDGKLSMLNAPYDAKLHAYITAHPILGEGALKVGKKQIEFRRAVSS